MSKKYILNFLLLIFLTISCTKDQEKATPENQIEESVESTIKKQPKLIPPNTKSPAPPKFSICLLYTSPSPRDVEESRMPSSA